MLGSTHTRTTTRNAFSRALHLESETRSTTQVSRAVSDCIMAKKLSIPNMGHDVLTADYVRSALGSIQNSLLENSDMFLNLLKDGSKENSVETPSASDRTPPSSEDKRGILEPSTVEHFRKISMSNGEKTNGANAKFSVQSERNGGHAKKNLSGAETHGHLSFDADTLFTSSLSGATKAAGESFLLVSKYIRLQGEEICGVWKAYVHGFEEHSGKFHISFCDTRGGQLDVKLSETTYRVLGVEEVSVLRKRLGLSDTNPVPGETSEVESEHASTEKVHEVPKRKAYEEVASVRIAKEQMSGSLTQMVSEENAPENTSKEPKYGSPTCTVSEEAVLENASKEQMYGSLKRKVSELSTTCNRTEPPATRPPARPAEKPRAGKELVGRCITIRWPGNGCKYAALVVGFQNRGLQSRVHKVYYTADESTEVLDLTKREWKITEPGDTPWNASGLVGRRIAAFWPNEDSDDSEEERNGPDDDAQAFEVFVIAIVKSFTYKLMHTVDDVIVERDLKQEEEFWELLDDGVDEINGSELVSWSTCKSK